MKTETKTTKTGKCKDFKCTTCKRWIANPVMVNGEVYGSGCAKKARLALAIERDKEVIAQQQQDLKSFVAPTIELPSDATESEINLNLSLGNDVKIQVNDKVTITHIACDWFRSVA